MPDINKYITNNSISELRSAIDDAEGREVLFIGRISGGLVTKIDVIARGSDSSVAAVIHLANYGDVFIHNHPAGKIEPSDADVEVSSIAARSGVASFIVDNEVHQIYVLVEPMQPPKLSPISNERMQKLFDTDGPLSNVLENYEERDEQRIMMAEVINAFNYNKI